MSSANLFPRQENTYQRRYQGKGGQAGKAPLKGVESRTHDSGFRVAEIPAQVRAVDHGQSRKSGHEKCTECVRDQWRTSLRKAFLRANCRLMISSFSERALTVSASVSATVSPSSVLTGVSRASDRAISRSESGTDNPVSLN